MAVVTGMSASRMLAIEAASVVDGDVVSGNLELTKHDGSKIIAGSVIGPAGPSAYDSAVANGFVGTEAAWLATLQGVDGESAYDVAVANGFVGTEAAWLLSLKGADGSAGASFAGTPLGNNVNLNTITSPGVYTQAGNYHGGTNYPDLTSGVLEVFVIPTVGIFHRWTGLYDPNFILIRTCNIAISSWSPWVKLYVEPRHYLGYSLRTNQPIPNNTWTDIQWASGGTDFGNAIGINLITNEISIGTNGLYELSMNTKWSPNATGVRSLRILVNNVLLSETTKNGSTTEVNIALSKKRQCIASDKVKFQVFQTSGGNLDLVGDTNLSTAFEVLREG